MSFVSELVYSHVVETFIASYVLITVPFGVVLNTIAVLDFPLLLPAVSGTSLFVLFGSILLCFIESSNQLSHSYGFSALANFETVSFMFKTLFLLISSLIVTIYRNTMPNGQGFELDQLVLMALVGMLLLIVSNDLLLVYLAVELQSLCFYAIIGLNCYSELAIEASLKYFLIGALASCLLLFGFSLIYFGYGTTLFDNLFLLSYSTVYFSYNSLGIILVLIAFLIKLGVAPFHVWVCDVYEGSLTAITAFFATAPKLVLVLLFFKMFHVAFVSQISV
jgi:NADH-quinone oxidoreductase subunit N